MAEVQKAALESYNKIKAERGEVTALDMFIAGRDWFKNQMMKDAIDSVVVKPDYEARSVVKSMRLQIDDDSIACAYDKGDKVKVIIIKE